MQKRKKLNPQTICSHIFSPSSTDGDAQVLASKIIAAEASSVYHYCKRNLSCSSLDCANKLYPLQFSDSAVAVAKKFSSGRTKLEAMVKGVLAPESVTAAVDEIKLQNLPFLTASDASNWKNRKMYPLLIQYFSSKSGMQTKLLDFYEDPKEDARGIVTALKSSIDSLGLQLNNVSAYSADNANVNYGQHHTVYRLLQNDIPHIVKANCCAHIIHNTLKHALEQLYDVNVETIVMRTFNHSSS